MLGDAATLGDGTDTGKARVIMRNGKYPAGPAQSPVFADYAVGDVEQVQLIPIISLTTPMRFTGRTGRKNFLMSFWRVAVINWKNTCRSFWRQPLL